MSTGTIVCSRMTLLVFVPTSLASFQGVFRNQDLLRLVLDPSSCFGPNFKSAPLGSRSSPRIPNLVPDSQVLQKALEELYLWKSRAMKASEERELDS